MGRPGGMIFLGAMVFFGGTVFFGWWERERVEITEITEIYGLVFIFFYSVLF